MKPGRLIVISGPSGVGKTTIVKNLLQREGFVKITTSTTRPKRSMETEGKDYRFLTRKDFEEGLEKGDFLEHAEIYGNLYGTPRKPVEEALKEGKIVLLEIDVQGASSVRELGLEAFFIFIQPPTLDDLQKRLKGRESERAEEMRKRLDWAISEIRQASTYDLRVVNRDVREATEHILMELQRQGMTK